MNRFSTEKEREAIRSASNGKCLELGSFYGASALQFLEGGCDELTCIDMWGVNPDQQKRNALEHYLENIGDGYSRVRLLRMLTREAYPYILSNKYDVVLIDASHNNAEAMRDLCVCTLVSPIVMVHDYGYTTVDGEAKEVVDWFVRYNPKWNIVKIIDRLCFLGFNNL